MRRAVSAVLALLSLLAGAAGAAALSSREGAAQEKPRKQDVSNMDLDLLRENLLKLWIIEFTSREYNQGRIAQKSFEALNPAPATGDPELDAKNAEGRKKTDKELRHYLLLELDGSIEAVDICDRVLGQRVAIEGAEAERRRFLTKELPEIRWKNVLLQDAIRDLSRMAGAPVTLSPEIPPNVTMEVSLESPKGYTVLGVLEYINGIHPIEWEWKDGKLDVTYMGDLPRGPFRR